MSRINWIVIAVTMLLVGCDVNSGNTDGGSSKPLPLKPLPAIPEWAKPLIGKDTRQGFTKVYECKGAFDAVYNLHTQAPTGAETNGWGWLTTAKEAPKQIVFVDAGQIIVGAGQVDTDRPDVPKALNFVTDKHVGWHGVVTIGSGGVTALALLPGNKVCELGYKDLKQ